jgi:hypothetical protein
MDWCQGGAEQDVVDLGERGDGGGPFPRISSVLLGAPSSPPSEETTPFPLDGMQTSPDARHSRPMQFGASAM